MKTGHWILYTALVLIVMWAGWDVWAWVQGKSTASQIVISASEENPLYACLALSFCILIIAVGIWLIPHWELPRILKMWSKKNDRKKSL